MKILKSIGSLLIIACGAYVSYLAFLAYDLQAWTRTLIFLAAALLLLCFGIVTLLLTLTKKPSVQIDTSTSGEPRIAPMIPLETEEPPIHDDVEEIPIEHPVSTINPGDAQFTEATNSDEAAQPEDILPADFQVEEENELIEGMSEVAGQQHAETSAPDQEESFSEEAQVSSVDSEPVEVQQPIDVPIPVEVLDPSIPVKAIVTVEVIEEIEFPKFKTQSGQIDIKEDPKFLFGDWWVDEEGLYIDMRLIGIAGRKSQKILKKLPLNAKLEYHINSRNDAIEIVYNKVVLGLVPELYLHSLLMYIQGIESVKSDKIVKRGCDVVQFSVKVRFDEDLREQLQKKLQQKTWQ